MPPVALRIRDQLMRRARAINGLGEYYYAPSERVFAGEPVLDRLIEIADEELPAVWIWRTADDQRERLNNETLTRRTIRWTALMIVPEGEDKGASLEYALADLERAFEIESDRYMEDEGEPLLCDELAVASSSFAVDSEIAGVQCAAVDIVTAHIHHYGDPAKL